jgi:hypothetical protein
MAEPTFELWADVKLTPAAVAMFPKLQGRSGTVVRYERSGRPLVRWVGQKTATAWDASLLERAQDDSELRKEAAFLLARLDDLERGWDTEEAFNDFIGHVSPSMARLRALLGSPHPIKDTTK